MKKVQREENVTWKKYSHEESASWKNTKKHKKSATRKKPNMNVVHMSKV